MSNKGFWNELPHICSILAPMADITDPAFRRMVVNHGKPDVIYTEFVSAEGLMSEGRNVLSRDLKYNEAERPIVVKIFGSDPVTCAKATEYLCSLGFDGVEINMGCPDKSVMKQGAGASLIDNPELAKTIIQEMKKAGGKVPISVKTRLGIKKDTLDDWFSVLLEARPAAITLHARTAKELSLVPARWERISDAVRMAEGSGTRIHGNGDITSLEDGRKRARESGAHGFMVGRSTIGNPFFFSGRSDVSTSERLAAMLEHAQIFERLMPWEPFVNVRKHLSKYASGFRGAKELRINLMQAHCSADVTSALDKLL